jgi:hypothetical protein
MRIDPKTYVVLVAAAFSSCGKKSNSQNEMSEAIGGAKGFMSSKSDYYADLKGVDTNEKRKPLVIYYAVNQSAEPMMAVHVTRDLQRLRKICAKGIDSVAFVNSHFAEAQTKDNRKFYIMCRNKNLSIRDLGGATAQINSVIGRASQGQEPEGSPIALKYTADSRKYASEFKKVPYAHPEVMKILLEHAISVFPSDQYAYFLHIKSHGAQATGGDLENALVMTGLTDEALLMKRWGNPSDNKKEGQIHNFIGKGVFKSQAEMERALGGYREINGKLVFVNGGREGIAQTLKLDKTADKGSLVVNCGDNDCLGVDDFNRMDISNGNTMSANDGNTLSANDSTSLDVTSAAGLDVSSAAGLDVSNGYALDISGGSNTGLGAENYFGTNGRVMKELLATVFNGNKSLKFAIFESCSNSFGRSEEALKDIKDRVAKGKLNLSMFYAPTGTLAYENIKWDVVANKNQPTTPGLQYSLITITNEVKSAAPKK